MFRGIAMLFCYMKAMKLTQLKYFIAVAEAKSTTKAAKILNLTQPAVTRGIRQLEAELGIELFVRLPRSMRLTRFGEAYLKHARAIFVQLENAQAEISYLEKNPVEEIVIGAGPTWLRSLLPEVVGDFSREFPDVSIRVRGGYDQQLLSMLDRGEVAFVLTETSNEKPQTSHTQEPLIYSEYVVAARKDHPLATLKQVTLEQLLKFPWAMPDQAASALDRLHGLYLTSSLPAPEPQIKSTSLNFILKLLTRSDALSFVVKSSLDEKLWQEVIPLSVDTVMPVRHAGIVKRSDSWQSPVVEQLVSRLRASCIENPEQ